MTLNINGVEIDTDTLNGHADPIGETGIDAYDIFPIQCEIQKCTQGAIDTCSKYEVIGRSVSIACRFYGGGCEGTDGLKEHGNWNKTFSVNQC